jgi:GNAT superfamily N-acetyltransferase
MQPWTALQRCLQAHCFLRSLLRPSRVVRRGPLVGLEELPSAKPERKRREFFARAKHVAAAIEELDAFLPRDRQVLSIPLADDALAVRITKRCKQAGYRLGGSEFLFARGGSPPTSLPQCEYEIAFVQTEELAERVAKAQRRRLTGTEYLRESNSPLRLYCALDVERPIAWAQSIAAGKGVRYVANLYTARPYRRRGIATALMSRLLRDDAKLGAAKSVLLSSHTGRCLYEQLGYRELGRLLMFWGRNA